jgi:myosin heavy subunit
MCQLLGIEESQMRMWLCNRKFTAVGEVLTKPLTSEQVRVPVTDKTTHIRTGKSTSY